jgi:sortase A
MVPVIAALLVAAVGVGLVIVGPIRGRRETRLVDALSVQAAAPSRPPEPSGRLVRVLRQRPWARRSLSALSVALLLGAAGVLGWPFFTNVYQDRVQSRLGGQLASPSPELEQAFRADRVAVGDPLTRLTIDAIDLSTVVVEGTTASALRAGSGHYPQTPLPCEQGNVAIAGHRTTFGRPFHNLDRLDPGDVITLETPVGACTYVVDAAPFIVAPTALSVVEDKGRPMLTLTTCHPKGSAAQRLIITATLQGPATQT